MKGDPFAKVILKIEGTYGSEGTTVQTDETGRFLLTNINVGWHELIIDGRLARRRLNAQSAALAPQEDHGVFEYGLEIKEGQTTTLPFTIWLPKIDKTLEPVPRRCPSLADEGRKGVDGHTRGVRCEDGAA